MVDYYKLDKTFVQGKTYTLPADRFYVINKIGTNATADAYLKIDGVDTGKVITDLAPLHKTTTNFLGPLSLEGLEYVVPPNKVFTVEGPSGAKVRCKGLIGRLAVGEGMPPQWASRFTEQGKRYRTYIYGVATLAAAGASWPAGASTTVLTLTPKTIEEYTLNSVVMALLENNATTVSEGSLALRFSLDGAPLDILTSDPGQLGVDYFSMPKPPAGTTELEPFTLEDKPIRVPGDHTLKIEAVNTSGAAIAAASGAAMTMKVWAIVEYAMKG